MQDYPNYVQALWLGFILLVLPLLIVGAVRLFDKVVTRKGL